MSYSLDFFKWGDLGEYVGEHYRGCYGDTRSVDHSSYGKTVGITVWVTKDCFHLLLAACIF